MGNQIIKQPTGRYAIFSSNSDQIILWDATADQVVAEFVGWVVEDTERRVREHLANVDAGEPEKSYHQFAMTWAEALADDKTHGGEAHRHFNRDGTRR